MRTLVLTFAAGLLVMLAACNGGSNGNPPTQPTPDPAAVVGATGDGLLVIHPSALGANFALEVPIRITETGGGTADWTSARITFLAADGQEIARRELTADDIAAGGFTRIAARQDESYVLVFQINNTEFDDLTLTLRFVDRRDGELIVVDVPGTTFDGVDISLEPLNRPEAGHRLE